MNFIRYDSPFARFMNRLVDIVVLGVITLGCCIPIVTVGAAFSALYYVTLKMVRGNDGNIIRQYFKAFKQNFWKGTALWIIMAVVITLLAADFTLLNTRDFAFEDALRIMLIIMTVLAALVGSYIFPMQAQFENPVFRTIKNSFILSIMNLPRSILILLVKLSPLLVILVYPEVMYILGIFCIAGLPYMETELFVKIFDKYMPEKASEDESEEQPMIAAEPTPVIFNESDEAEEDE